MLFERYNLRKTLSHVLRLARLVRASEPYWVGVLILLALALGLIPAAEFILMRALVNALVEATRTHSWTHWLAALIALSIILRTLGQLGMRLRNLVELEVGENATTHLVTQIQALSSRVPIQEYDNVEFLDDLERVKVGTGLEFLQLISSSVSMLEAGVATVGVLAVAAAVDPWAPLVILLAGLPVFLLRARFAVNRYWANNRRTPERRLMHYLFRIGTGREAAREVRFFHIGDYLARRWRGLYRNIRREVTSLRRRQRLVLSLVECGSVAVLGLGLVILLRDRPGIHSSSLGTYVAAVYAVVQLQSLWNVLIGGFVEFQEATQYFVGVLFRYFGRAEAASASTPDGLHPIAVATAPPFHPTDRQSRAALIAGKSRVRPAAGGQGSPVGPRLYLQGVSYRYPGRTDYAVRGITLTLAVGETVALVGRNGAGKTTLVKLILGLLQPCEGHICWVTHYSIAETPKGSASFQDFVRYQLTLGQNIGLGDVRTLEDGSHHSASTIAAAATLAGISHLAESLPAGYDTMLGAAFGGIDLSWGEWQKVAVARSIVPEAELWVLDEPISSADPEAEIDFYRHVLTQPNRSRLTIMTSHRLAFCKYADRIIVLDQGTVIQTGSHSELLEAGGLYAEMFRTHAGWYE